MKKLITAILCIYGSVQIEAEDNKEYLNRVANAIYWAEGGKKSRRPFGLIRYKLNTTAEYKSACIKELQKYYNSWIIEKRPKDFITYLGESWAPTKRVSSYTAKLNSNWIRNVKYYMLHPKPI